MGVWEVGGMGEKTKMEDRGSKIECVSISLAILDHPSSILKPSPTLSQTTTTLPDLVSDVR